MSETKKRIQVDLTGRIALVTARPRTGRALPLIWPRRAPKVACVDINTETLAETVPAIQAAGGAAQPIAADVTNSQRVDEVIGAVVKLWGGLDILVKRRDHPRQPDHADERRSMGCRLEHQPQGHLPLHPGSFATLCKSKFGIINIASVSGLMGNPGQANYWPPRRA